MTSETSTSLPRRAGVLRKTLRVLAFASTLILVVALAGQVFRDRTRWLAVLMYLPMGFVALFVSVIQLIAFERRIWKRRLAVILVAAVAGAMSVCSMRGRGYASAPVESLDVVQWNVQWGRHDHRWVKTVRQVTTAGPDVIVLSEAPSDEKIAALCAALGSEWMFKVSRNAPQSRYWYAIAVASRGPISIEREWQLPNGAALQVLIGGTEGSLRVLAVDGLSDPLISRTPMLRAIADQCRLASESFAPVDIVAGDFNAVSRSVGFDALKAQGFTLGSRASRGWRGTYPASLPLYDIDHVWLAPGHAAASCEMLESSITNHRGQLVRASRAN